MEVAGRHPAYGSRRVAAELKRAPYKMSLGRPLARRLMRELGLTIKPKQRRVPAYQPFPNLLKGLPVLRNQV